MEEIMNDMELALEGVPFSESNVYIKQGIAYLEHKAPNFTYSREDLKLSEKLMEIKLYFVNQGFDIREILDLISEQRVSKAI